MALNNDDFDFELPPLPEIKKPLRNINTQKSESEAASANAFKSDISAVDILTAPEAKTPVQIPKNNVNTTSQRNLSSEDSVKKAMNETAKALKYIEKASNTPFEREEVPVSKKASDDLSDVDVSNVVLDDMTDFSKKSSMSSNTERAIKNMVMLDEISHDMESSVPVLEDLSSEYTGARKKEKDKLLSYDSVLNSTEKKAIKDRMHEEIYHKSEDFDRNRENYLKNKLLSETRIKKSKKGMLITFLSMFMILGCTAIMFFLLHNYDELFTYMSAVTLIAALILFIRSGKAKSVSLFLLTINTIVLVVPGLIFMVLDLYGSPVDERLYSVLFVGAIILCIVPMIILSKNNFVYIYFHTDKNGEEK